MSSIELLKRRLLPDFGTIPKYGRDYLRVLVAEYDGLPKVADYREPPVISAFRAQTDDRQWTWADVVVVENALLNATQDSDLRALVVRWRERYRDIVGDTRFAFYMQSGPPDPKSAPPDQLRADVRALADRIHYLLATISAREKMRNRLSLLLSTVMIFTIILMFGNAVVWAHGVPTVAMQCVMGLRGCAELMPVQFVVLAGVVGGFVSVQQRLQSGGLADPFFRRLELSSGWGSIILISPLIGGVFGLVLYELFVSGAISGTALPQFATPRNEVGGVPFGSFVAAGKPTSATEWAKLAIWSFLAGFAERLVPDALTRLSNIKNLFPDAQP